MNSFYGYGPQKPDENKFSTRKIMIYYDKRQKYFSRTGYAFKRDLGETT